MSRVSNNDDNHNKSNNTLLLHRLFIITIRRLNYYDVYSCLSRQNSSELSC